MSARPRSSSVGWAVTRGPGVASATPPSPYGVGLRIAWWGRVSTEDQQDPTLSLPRQLHNSRAVLPAGATIVAHFFDVESGRKDLDARGYSKAHERFDIPIPRDGGIQDLLAEAHRADRRFDAVICESIERVARRTYYGTKIEHDLEADGVALFAADEPISVTGKRATTILTRRVKQGVAEWYVLETLEKSWDGFCGHTRQGWNIGRPPYGYQGQKIPHPVPARRAEGKTKTRLAPDPVTGPVVTAIFTWRVLERLGYQAIVDRLNADLDRYPAPTSPDPARNRNDWTRSSIQALLTNPKYTGYMVWNRRATKKGGQPNSPEQWVWSAQPTHEPLVTRDLFDAAQCIGGQRRGSRTANTMNRHPATKRVYLLRSYVICACAGGECSERRYAARRITHASPVSTSARPRRCATPIIPAASGSGKSIFSPGCIGFSMSASSVPIALTCLPLTSTSTAPNNATTTPRGVTRSSAPSPRSPNVKTGSSPPSKPATTPPARFSTGSANEWTALEAERTAKLAALAVNSTRTSI